MKEALEILKALSDENRMRIYLMLQQKPMCACELLSVLDIAGSTLSAHLKILRNANLIEQKKEGRWIEYGIKISQLNKKLETFLLETLIADPQIIQQDRKKAQALDRLSCSQQKQTGENNLH